MAVNPPIQDKLINQNGMTPQTWILWFNYVARIIEELNAGGVTSVNGETGVVVLDTDNIAEGSTNLYNVVPAGGTTGQYLSKDSATDYDMSWGDAPNPFDQSLNTTDEVSFQTVTYDTSYTEDGNEAQGTVFWNPDEETLNLVQNGAILQLGQEVQVHCRNNSGSDIANGTVVMATGSLGASGRITIAPYDNISEVKYIMGVTTEDIANDTDGKVTTFGKVRHVDTSSWSDGDVLYTTAGGGLTSTEPTSGIKNAIAFVINSNVNGTLFVRETAIDENAYEPADNTILKDADIGVTVQAWSSVLDATTASFTTADETNLDANTAARHDALTVTDSSEIDFTLTGQDLTASLVAGSIDETKLDTSVNASLDLADSALQNVVEDTTPQLGGNLDVNGNEITSASGDVDITPNSAKVNINGATGLFALNVAGTGLNGRMSFQGGSGGNPGIQLQTDTLQAGRRVLMRMNESGGSGSEIQFYTRPDAGGSVVNYWTMRADGEWDGSGDITTTGDLTCADIIVSGTVDGRDIAADGSKLDGIEAGADVTDEANVTDALDGATLTDVGTPASGDLILLQDASDSNILKVAQFSTFGGGGGSGTVTSVAISGSDGIEVDSGSPITTSGTIALGLNKSTTLTFLNVEDGADVTDEANVTDALDGATLSAVTVATDDKVLIQDTSDSDILKTVTAQSIADLASGGGGITIGTPQATTSGTSFNFGSIPSGTKMIKIILNGVSLNGTDDLIVQIGDSGGIETTGYDSTSRVTTISISSTAGFAVYGRATTTVNTLIMTLCLIDSSTNTWVAEHSGQLLVGPTRYSVNGGGSKSLSGELTQVTLTRTGTNTFDAGQVNIQYL